MSLLGLQPFSTNTVLPLCPVLPTWSSGRTQCIPQQQSVNAVDNDDTQPPSADTQSMPDSGLRDLVQLSNLALNRCDLPSFQVEKQTSENPELIKDQRPGSRAKTNPGLSDSRLKPLPTCSNGHCAGRQRSPLCGLATPCSMSIMPTVPSQVTFRMTL